MADDILQGVPPLPPRYRFRDLILFETPTAEADRWGRIPFLGRFLSDEDDDDRVRVEFFANEKSLKQRLQLYFLKNQRSSLRIRLFNLFIKLLSCVLYVVRVSLEDPNDSGKEYNIACDNSTEVFLTVTATDTTTDIQWSRLLWVSRNQWLWGIQVTVAIVSLLETLLLTYLSYKGNILQQILAPGFLLELINTVPFIVTIFHRDFRDLFVPVFLNCWLAKTALENMLNDLHRAMQKTQSALAQQLLILLSTLACLFYTSMCGIQHCQRASSHHFSLFNSLWFVVVTFSTVGYGDFAPDIWPSKLFMMILIGAAFVVLPSQFEQLAFTWFERQKQGGTYSSHRAQNEKHVVVVATQLQADTIMDFLNEFYAHGKLQDYFVVLLSPSELDPTMKLILQIPLWAQRVIYIQGSALKDSDLSRCRMQDAEACFMVAARNFSERNAADQHTILRSWAVKDFAPHCPQYVTIYRPDNKFHVKFAEHVVCEEELKYALLANNCQVPAVSTLVTLLLHTSRGQEGQTSSEKWMRHYGRCSGNEIYSINLGKSKFFGEYEEKSFSYASFHAHRKYGVALVGIKQEMPGATIQLNPGPRHVMQATDTCYYMSITKEENSTFTPPPSADQRNGKSELSRSASYNKMASMVAGVGGLALTVQVDPEETPDGTCLLPHHETGSVAMELKQKVKRGSFHTGGGNSLDVPQDQTAGLQNRGRRPSIAAVPDILTDGRVEARSGSESSEVESDQASVDQDPEDPGYIKGFPPVPPYIGTSPTLCHLLKDKRSPCCMQLAQSCAHCNNHHAHQYNWRNRIVIVAADHASYGLYNFIVPLRSHCRSKHKLSPIVLLLERRPEQSFLETICFFPEVYWMIGSIDCLDDLLRAGVNLADHLVIANKESSNAAEEETLADCNTIVAVQTIFRLFPSANIITELSQASNMRFMQFRAKDHYALALSKLEKKEKERGSHLYYMFRLPFAAGNVFSASMLDTLLYQAFVKDYLITFVRLLLGVDQAVGSGHLTSTLIKPEDKWIRTYGRLYQKLCATTGEIPIGIYRTEDQHGNTGSATVSLSDEEQSNTTIAVERHEIKQLVVGHMESLGLPVEECTGVINEATDNRHTISYVIINPSYDMQLNVGDIIYLIRPSSLSPQPTPLIDQRSRSLMMQRGEPSGAETSRFDHSADHSTGQCSHHMAPLVTVDTASDLELNVTAAGGGGQQGVLV